VRLIERTTSDGIVLCGEAAGNPEAPTVLLMHGGGQTRHSWMGALSEFAAAGYHALSYDARGHGESGWSRDGDYCLNVRARDMLEMLGPARGPVALVGASLGGATAMWALCHGYRPAAVSLVDIVPRPDPRGVQRIRDFMLGHPRGFACLEEAIDAVAAYNPHRPRPANTAGLMKNLRCGADGRLHWHWDPQILARPLDEEMAEFLQAVDGLKQVRGVPIQLVRGLESDVVTDSGIHELRESISDLELYDVAGAGHMVAGDRNDVFIQGVLQFLRRHLPLSGAAFDGA
jgi:pimeloyl-ACP methyl ester carboxylesterase